MHNFSGKYSDNQNYRPSFTEKILENIDINYSYQLAKRMENYRSNEVLGYRPAGSVAEFETGELLKNEMEQIGLSIPVNSELSKIIPISLEAKYDYN